MSMPHSSASRAGQLASLLCSLLTILALALGVTIVARIGGASGLDVARTSPGALRSIQPLLVAAEWLKIVTGAAVLVVVVGSHRLLGRSRPTLLAGLAGAVLLLGAGVCGLLALRELDVADGGPALGNVTAMLGLAAAAVTGVWAALLVRAVPKTQRWLRVVAFMLAGTGVVALLFPPIGLAFGVLSVIWWFGLSRLFRRSRWLDF